LWYLKKAQQYRDVFRQVNRSGLLGCDERLDALLVPFDWVVEQKLGQLKRPFHPDAS
jgi:hypothetical protein